MDARDVLDVLAILEEDGIDVILHGGWGIDAVIGSQDRDHDDIDIMIAEPKLPAAVTSLGCVGFAVTADDPSEGGPATVTMANRAGLRIDLTALRLDDAEVRWMGDGQAAVAFPPSAFTDGWVAGREVRCVGAVKQVELHRGYEPRPSDRHDMTALKDKFGISLPTEYR